MYNTTTIRIKIETKKELDKLKIHPRESYDEFLKRLVILAKKKEVKRK